jgi:hypothetical protein
MHDAWLARLGRKRLIIIYDFGGRKCKPYISSSLSEGHWVRKGCAKWGRVGRTGMATNSEFVQRYHADSRDVQYPSG